MGTWESSGIPETSELNYRGQTPRLEVSFISLKSYQNVDVQNGLAWAIWTSAT